MALAPKVFETVQTDPLLIALTFQPADGGDPLRVVNNNEPIVSNGEIFEAYPFQLKLASQGGARTPTVELTIDNVDLRITQSIRELEEPPTVTLQMLWASDPDHIEMEIAFLRLVKASYDAATVRGSLQAVDVLSQATADTAYTPSEFPDLFYA